MGVFRSSFAPIADEAREIKALLDKRFTAPVAPGDRTARAAVPLNPGLAPLPPQQPYEVYAREGYSQNDIVYSCIQCLGTSAAEPVIAAWQGKGKNEQPVEDHEVLDLLQRPNRWLTGYQFVFTIMMYRSLAGNVFIEKVRSGSKKVVELWPLRPDRVHILADPDNFIAGYRYQIGGHWWDIPPEDIIHLRTPNPLNDYYGMPPLMPLAGRVDIDNWSRAFIASFFRNGGVPAGLLTLKRPLQEGERELIQSRFRGDYGGPAGWHNIAIIDIEGAEVDFKAAGLPLGERGLVLPELNFISEARIAGAFGVPLSLVGSVLGMHSSSYANRVSDRESFWHETLSPLYKELGDGLTMGLAQEYPDIDRIGFDLSTVLALMPDADKLHARLRDDMAAGGISQEEFRAGTGFDDDVNPDDTFVIGVNLQTLKGRDMIEATPPPVDANPDGTQPFPSPDGAEPPAKTGAQNGAGDGDQAKGTAGSVGGGGEQSGKVLMKGWIEHLEQKAIAPTTGMMICCYVDSPDLPFDPAEGSLGTEVLPQSDRHITLAYVPDPTPEQVKAAQDCAQMVAHHLPLPIQISGVGRFATEADVGRDPFIALVDSPFLHDLRTELVAHLQRKGVPVSTEHAFVPHVTLSYLSREDPSPLPGGLKAPIPVLLDNIAVKAGGLPPVRYTSGSSAARLNGESKEWVPATRN